MFTPPPMIQFNPRNALIDTQPLSDGISNLGNALAERRHRMNRAEIGKAAQGGNMEAARDLSFQHGYIDSD